MNTVSKEAFEAFVSANCPMHARDEPRVEHDIDVRYDCYDNDDGDEVAFAEWRNGTATYYVQEQAEDEDDGTSDFPAPMFVKL